MDVLLMLEELITKTRKYESTKKPGGVLIYCRLPSIRSRYNGKLYLSTVFFFYFRPFVLS
jgi:hypothetical protein